MTAASLVADVLAVVPPHVRPAVEGIARRHGVEVPDASRPEPATPTDRQLQVLRILTIAETDRRPPPSLREVAEDLGVTSATGVLYHLQALQRKGLASGGDYCAARSWRATEAGWRVVLATEAP